MQADCAGQSRKQENPRASLGSNAAQLVGADPCLTQESVALHTRTNSSEAVLHCVSGRQMAGPPSLLLPQIDFGAHPSSATQGVTDESYNPSPQPPPSRTRINTTFGQNLLIHFLRASKRGSAILHFFLNLSIVILTISSKIPTLIAFFNILKIKIIKNHLSIQVIFNYPCGIRDLNFLSKNHRYHFDN